MLRYDRDYNEDPYWHSNNFWPKFLRNPHFDHAYLVDVFKTMVGDCDHRTWILKHMVGEEEDITANYYADDISTEKLLNEVRITWQLARRRRITAFITWVYPPVADEEGNDESHYFMLIADARNKTVLSIDPRGTEYIARFSSVWHDSFLQLQRIFKDCLWNDIVEEDLQSFNSNDHFCQTWSLVLAVAIYKGVCAVKGGGVNNSKIALKKAAADALRLMDDYGAIINFWQRLLSMPHCTEALYYEIYCKTHYADGCRKYHRYFSQLESLVHGSDSHGYEVSITYSQAGYDFIESFVDSLDSNVLTTILE